MLFADPARSIPYIVDSYKTRDARIMIVLALMCFAMTCRSTHLSNKSMIVHQRRVGHSWWRALELESDHEFTAAQLESVIVDFTSASRHWHA